MKIRLGFVSNSSSSIFIGLGDPCNIVPPEPGEHVIFDKGAIEFGWDNIRYTSVYTPVATRINFAYLQAQDSSPENMAMLMQVLEEYFGCPPTVREFSSDYCYYTPYIDHQSLGGSNLQMFESPETLATFLFASDSYIQGGNDNT